MSLVQSPAPLHLRLAVQGTIAGYQKDPDASDTEHLFSDAIRDLAQSELKMVESETNRIQLVKAIYARPEWAWVEVAIVASELDGDGALTGRTWTLERKVTWSMKSDGFWSAES